MKDILRLMRFDFLTASAISKSSSEYIAGVFMIVIALAVPLFIFPHSSFMYIFLAAPLIIPLQSYAEKSGFNKLYGILPVKRKSITRARFLYIFLTHFAMEIVSMLILVISIYAKLYELLPIGKAFMEGSEDLYAPEKLPDIMTIFMGWFIFLCFTFAFMEMYGQIHGRQSEMKVLFIMIGAFCVIVLGGIFILGQLGYPELKLDMPAWAAVLITNLGMLGVCVLFGEITAAKLAKREL